MVNTQCLSFMHLSMVCLPPPSRAIIENEEIFFVLLQNRAPVVGHLPTPVFYKQSTCIWDIYLMMFSFSAKSSSVCAVCVNNGYVHFTCRQSNPPCQPEIWTGICNENLPRGWGNKHLPHLCSGGGEWGIQLIGALRHINRQPCAC